MQIYIVFKLRVIAIRYVTVFCVIIEVNHPYTLKISHIKSCNTELIDLNFGVSCFQVNVAHKPLQGSATMNGIPHTPNWSADKVVDGNTNQTANGGSCAIMDFSKNYRSVWLNVQLQRLFNVAYIEIYFRNENSMLNMLLRYLSTKTKAGKRK